MTDIPPPDLPEDDLPEDDLPEFDDPELLEDEPDDLPRDELPEPPQPVNWNVLGADEAEQEWLALSEWVNWLRRTYGLPAAIVPPAWHKHPELVWELSALHLHWLGAYDPEQDGSAPIGWHHDFAEARERLREWVAASGTRLDCDRPTRITDWPGEEPTEQIGEAVIEDRAEDFVLFVRADVERRRAIEDAWLRDVVAGESDG